MKASDQIENRHPLSHTRTLIIRSSPAIVLVCIMLMPPLLQPIFKDRTFLRYRNEVATALAEGDFETAELFAQKMIELAPADDALASFQFAAVEMLRGHVDSAQIIMQRLAPVSSSGFAPAHLWLARHYLQVLEKPEPEQTGVILHHLRVAMHELPDLTEPYLLLADVSQKNGNLRAAIESLEKIIDRDPSLHFLLAELYRQISDAQKAALHYEAAAHYCRIALNNDPKLLDQWSNLGKCYFQQQRFGEAEQTFSEGLQLFQLDSDQQSVVVLAGIYSALCAEEYVRQLSECAGDDLSDEVQALYFLGKALQYDPGNEIAINALLSYSRLPETEAVLVEEAISCLISSDDQIPVHHLILGILNSRPSETPEANLPLGVACKMDPGFVLALNNLAVKTMELDAPDLSKALQYTNEAVEAVDSSSSVYPQLMATRGQMYAKLGNWEASRADLNTALQGTGDQTNLHRVLAIVCRNLGHDTEADEHERLAGSD
jgi:tetratricopeptide (TPR) repeat protein